MVDKTKFCVIAQARSGSTLLRHALNAHPEICCHGEVLSRQWINGLVPIDNPTIDRSPKPVVERLLAARDDDIGHFLDKHVYAIDMPCVGFKIVYEDLFKSDASEQIFDYLHQNHIHIIHLVRLNKFRAYVSLVRMSKFGVTHSDSHKESKDIHPIEIEEQKFLAYKQRQGKYESDIDTLFSNQLVSKIHYEDIEAGYEIALERIGLQPHQMEQRLTKVGVVNLNEYILNYEKLVKFDTA